MDKSFLKQGYKKYTEQGIHVNRKTLSIQLINFVEAFYGDGNFMPRWKLFTALDGLGLHRR